MTSSEHIYSHLNKIVTFLEDERDDLQDAIDPDVPDSHNAERYGKINGLSLAIGSLLPVLDILGAQVEREIYDEPAQ